MLAIFHLDRKAMTSEFKPSIVVPLAPFFGSMGVAPAPARGRMSGNPLGRHAGNLDNRERSIGHLLLSCLCRSASASTIGSADSLTADLVASCVITSVIMAAVGVLACAAPARRALRIQPTEALRQG